MVIRVDKEKILLWGAEKMQQADATPLEIGYRYYHGLRTAALAGALARAMGLKVDAEALYIGAFLHDVGKAECSGFGHGRGGKEVIEAEIPHLFTPAELAKVTDIVANHYRRPCQGGKNSDRHPFSAEVLLVQDADALDHFGSSAVWLAFHWSKHQGRNQSQTIQFYHNEDLLWRQRALAGLNYDLSRREMEYRLGRIDEFFAHFAKEEAGALTMPPLTCP